MESIVKLIFTLSLISHLTALDPSKDIEGKDCIVVEPIRNYTFNLTGLRTELGRTIRSSDHPDSVLLNVCGQLTKLCNGQKAAACVTDSTKKEIVYGYNDKLVWNDGLLRFKFEGDKCDDKRNYTMNLILSCDYAESHEAMGMFHDSEKCEAHAFLPTSLACLEAPKNLLSPSCVVKSPSGEIFNFSPLKNSNHKAAGKNGTTFTIGVCNPVLYTHEVTCEPGTSICLFDSKAKDHSSQYKNMGMMTEDFKYEADGEISLTMTSSEICEGKKKYTSRIIFECDPLADYSMPTYHGTIDCVHVFQWPTLLACPTKNKSCQVTHSDSGITYDFSSLAGIQYEALNKNNTEEKILFSICSGANEPCMKTTGSCVVKGKQSTQAGLANDVLKLDGKNPYLLYENGAICKKVGSKFTTRVDFICADNAADEGAMAIEDGCSITIHFKTLLACASIKACVFKGSDEQDIDFRPLIDYDGSYVAIVNEMALPKEIKPVQYLLNVCRPLNSKYSLNCRGTAGACRTVIESDGKHEDEMNLGHPAYSVVSTKVGESEEVIMKYFDGAICPTDTTETVATRIKFFCNEKVGLGNPTLQSIENCEYSFDFPTNLLCNERTIEVEKDSCSLMNPQVSVSVDLKLFGSNGVYKVGDKEVNICGGNETKYYTIAYKQSMVRIEFSQANGKGEMNFRLVTCARTIFRNFNLDEIDVEVQLKCSATNQTTSKIDERILVMHESPFICPLLNMTAKVSSAVLATTAASTDDTKEEEPSRGMALGYVFLISIVIVAFVAFYLVIRNPERREILKNLIKFRSTSSPVQYSRVRLNEESLLLENNNAGLSDSDDDNILL